MEQVVFVKCSLSRGAFPTECVFRMTAPGGGDYLGTAPLNYCRGASRERLAGELQADTDGYVVGVLIGHTKERLPRVYMPNGEVYDLSDDQVESAEDPNRVPVGT